MSAEYISLREASELCPYSEDYLRLRARQGKLRAVKTNGEWKTIEEVLRMIIE